MLCETGNEMEYTTDISERPFSLARRGRAAPGGSKDSLPLGPEAERRDVDIVPS
jgi:hypothetical protein